MNTAKISKYLYNVSIVNSTSTKVSIRKTSFFSRISNFDCCEISPPKQYFLHLSQSAQEIACDVTWVSSTPFVTRCNPLQPALHEKAVGSLTTTTTTTKRVCRWIKSSLKKEKKKKKNRLSLTNLPHKVQALKSLTKKQNKNIKNNEQKQQKQTNKQKTNQPINQTKNKQKQNKTTTTTNKTKNSNNPISPWIIYLARTCTKIVNNPPTQTHTHKTTATTIKKNN